MDFNPDTWGTVADWVGGLGTTAAFVATFVVILRDAKVRRMEQAAKIAYFSEVTGIGDSPPTKATWRHVVVNLSQEPIYRVRIYHGPRRKTAENVFVQGASVLLPGEKLEHVEPFADELKHHDLSFEDNAGRFWTRTPFGGLQEPILDNRVPKHLR